MTRSFLFDGLDADGPASDRADKMGLYGWLVGAWSMEAQIHRADGSRHEGRGRIWAGWVLEGRAVQDVWSLPGIFHGTTLRIFDPGLDAWRILWSDPLHQVHVRQIGRAGAGGIVQEGHNEDGSRSRWSFSDITPHSFLWLGERSEDDGRTWMRRVEIAAKRTAGPS